MSTDVNKQPLLQAKDITVRFGGLTAVDSVSATFMPGEPSDGVREHLSRRLARTIRSLNHLNYEARWEAHANSPRIILNHCPYAAIIANHPELCQVDALMLQKALGVSVTQQIKLGHNAQGLPFCVFQLGGNQG